MAARPASVAARAASVVVRQSGSARVPESSGCPPAPGATLASLAAGYRERRANRTANRPARTIATPAASTSPRPDPVIGSDPL
ncbi:MAG: hypothetical protein QOJ50_3961 [Cryptosporangiaceae bacterium]|nr:hypothetical protein [Cryptosporangiaceae bacterium]